MKQSALLIFAIAFFVTSTFSVHAQTSTASTTDGGGSIFDSVVKSVTNITETVQEQLPLPKPAPKSILSERAQERITNLAANISNRFDGIIARLENIHNRLETRIVKLEEAGVDMSQARQSLTKSREALDRAKGELRGIDEAVVYVVGSTDPKTSWQQVRLTFISARTEVRTAHTELRNTVANLKNVPPATTVN